MRVRKVKKYLGEFYEQLGCLIWIAVVIVCCVLLSVADGCEERDAAIVEARINAATFVEQKGDSCLRAADMNLAVKYYKEAYDIFDCDSLAAKIMTYEQQAGNIDEALRWLDILSERMGESDFISLRRSDMMLQIGDTAAAVKILDEIIASPVKLNTTWVTTMLFDLWMYKEKNYTKIQRYFRYYIEYFGKLQALQRRLYLSKSYDECLAVGKSLFLLTEDRDNDYEIMDNYAEIHKEYLNTYRTRAINHLGLRWGMSLSIESVGDIKYLLSHVLYTIGIDGLGWNNVISQVSQLKWSIFNQLVYLGHRTYGYDGTIEYINSITNNNTRNTDSYYNYHKYIYGIYLGAGNKNAYPSSLSVSEMDSLINCTNRVNDSICYITIGRKATYVDSGDERIVFEGDLYDPIIILGCNDWNNNDALAFHLYIHSKKGKQKTLYYIDDNLKACEATTNKDLFGLSISYIQSCQTTLRILQAEYDKQRL